MEAWEPLGTCGLEIGSEQLASGRVAGRALRAATYLHGPRGYLQGGLCAGALLAAAQRFDDIGAPPTAVDVRLHAPTPLGVRLGVVDDRPGPGEHELELLHGESTVVSGSVQLLGHEVGSRAFDLLSLATVDLPSPVANERFPDCWVCGPDNDDGLRLLPGWHREGQVVEPWIADERFAVRPGVLDPAVVCAVLDCPTFWANVHHVEAQGAGAALLAGYHVRFFADAPVDEPLRVVAIADEPDGRKLHGRSALVDEEGVVYATASALWIAVERLPERTA